MRTFAIGDIHGGLKALIQVLNQIEIKVFEKMVMRSLFGNINASRNSA